MICQGEYRIDSRDVDQRNHCRPSGVLGILQEAAVSAACELGASREAMLEKYHSFWMLARIWYHLSRPLYWGERVQVRTWHRGGQGASTYRDFDLLVDGQPVGEAVSLWVLADARTRRLSRMSGVTEFQGTDGGALCKQRKLSHLAAPDELTAAGLRELHYSDTDVNGHVNNVRYADFICDALHMERLGERQFVSDLQVDYLAECRAGEVLELQTGTRDGLWYVHGMDGQKKRRFAGTAELSTLDRACAIK